MKKIILLFLVACTVQLSAQNWELGLTGGGVFYQGDLVEPDFAFDNGRFGYGLFIQRNFNEKLGLRLGFNAGKYGADDLDYDRFDGISQARALNFESSLSQLHLRLDYNLRSRYKTFYDNNGEKLDRSVVKERSVPLYDKDGEMYDSDTKIKRFWSPYIAFGPGLTLIDENIRNESLNGWDNYINGPNFKQEEDVPSSLFTVLGGGGVNLFLGERTKLGLEWIVNVPFSDYLDGVSENRDPGDDDWYSTIFLKISTSISAKDTDGDGILDRNDKCPEIPGLEELNGCPDADGDGITDKADKCPETPGSRALRGCPDSDEDGIADNVDDCPQLAGIESLNGCPDSDGDGVIDPEDNCPTVAGLAVLAGCPDSDGDGVMDSKDACPKVKGSAALNGCPDSDGDGVTDLDDKCPKVKGPASNDGCPVKVVKKEIEKKDQDVLDFAMRNIEFETNSDRITAESIKILDNVATVLKKYPTRGIRIGGHTDNVGNADYNLKLSEKRAKATMDYLNSKGGVNVSRMSYAGYGETAPISTNDTEEGRQRNRRVQISLKK